MNVPVSSLVTDPNHESPDLIDQRAGNDPTRQQSAGDVPVIVSPGEPLPVADTRPAGFAPVFAGWNVWDVWQSQDPIQGIGGAILNAGLSLDRQLRIWVEDSVQDGAPGVAVADPANPAALKGDQVQIIPNSGGLAAAATRSEVPELAGALQLGHQDSAALKRTVRFFNRGDRSVLPWPHDANYVLDAVYVPSSQSPITNAGPPSSLGGAASNAANAIGHGLETLAWVGAGIGILLVLANLRRK